MTTIDSGVCRVSPKEHWAWNRATHWRNWHGIWTLWHPQQSLEPSKQYRVIRALRADDNGAGKCLHHRNQWFSSTGPGQEVAWENGPWIMTEERHSLPNGIVHPNKDDFRILQFPNGDLGWLQLELKPDDPKCFVFGEVHFMLPDKSGRIPIVLGYGENGRIGAAQMLEEARETDEKPEPEWQGSVFQHYGHQPLEASRKKPAGNFVGQEMVLSTKLEMTTHSKVVWPGFGDESTGYTEVYFPLGFTAVLPSEPATGKQFDFHVHWIVNDHQVRMISWSYDENGKLVYIKRGDYTREESTI